jgi:hypothetical protein
MSLAAVALLLASSVTVHVEIGEGVPPEDVEQIAAQLARAIESRTGAETTADAGVIAACEVRPGCLEAIRRRTGADEVVLLSVVGVVTTIGLTVERFAASARSIQAQARLPIGDPSTRREELERLASALFPESRPPASVGELGEPTPVAAVQPPPPKPERSVLALVVAGGGAALLGASAALWVSQASSYDDLKRRLDQKDGDGLIVGVDYSGALSERSSIDLRRNSAAALAAAGIGAIAGGVLWWLLAEGPG